MASGSLFHELFQPGLYKRSQGRFTRQATFVTLLIAIALGAWRLMDFLITFSEEPLIHYGIPGALLIVGFWLSYRAVNITRFADFLIAVEAEMNKVTWPTRTELIRSSLVVIIVIFFMAAILFAYDMVWQFLFKMIGVLREAPENLP